MRTPEVDNLMPDSLMPNSLMKVGTLKKPYGIKGWLWVFSDIENRTAIFDMQPWWMKTATGFKPLTVSNWRQQGSGIVAQFSQIPDRNVAETMNGVTIWVTKDSLPKNADDEYYWSDLIGMTVINTQDERLGKVSDMFETGAHAIMTVVSTADSIDSEKRMIPWHKQTVIDVESDKGIITVDWEKDF